MWEKYGSLDFLSHVGLSIRPGHGGDLPSWAIDWRNVHAPGTPAKAFCSRQQAWPNDDMRDGDIHFSDARDALFLWVDWIDAVGILCLCVYPPTTPWR